MIYLRLVEFCERKSFLCYPRFHAICSKPLALDCDWQSCHLEREIVDIHRLCTMLLVPQVAAFLYNLDNFVISRGRSLRRLKKKIDFLSLNQYMAFPLFSRWMKQKATKYELKPTSSPLVLISGISKSEMTLVVKAPYPGGLVILVRWRNSVLEAPSSR